ISATGPHGGANRACLRMRQETVSLWLSTPIRRPSAAIRDRTSRLCLSATCDLGGKPDGACSAGRVGSVRSPAGLESRQTHWPVIATGKAGIFGLIVRAGRSRRVASLSAHLGRHRNLDEFEVFGGGGLLMRQATWNHNTVADAEPRFLATGEF